MSDSKEVKTKKVDVDVDKSYDLDIDANLDVNIDKDVDVDVNTSHTNIDVWAEGKAHAYIKKVDVDIDKSTTTETITVDVKKKDIDVDVDIDKDINISKEKWDVKVDVNADNIIQGSDVNEWQDNDVNDIDNQELIDIDDYGLVDMDDFTSDQIAIGDSFNGSGNDSQFNVNQANNLVDSDTVHGTKAEYNSEAPKHIDTSVHINNDADANAQAKAGAIGIGKAGDGGDGGDGGSGGHSYYKTHGGQGGTGGNGGDGYGIAGAAAGAVALNKSSIDDNYVDTSIDTGDGAFQDVSAKGGTANSGDGIGTAEGWGLASDNEGDGTISGGSLASADGVATAEAFTANVLAGGNQQANFATLNVTGGDLVDGGDGVHPAGSGPYKGGNDGKDVHEDYGSGGILDADGGIAIKDSWVNSDLDNDVNDLDSSELINVSETGTLYMDDFDLDVTAIGGSFNGSGNDMQFSFDQTNDLVDNDYVQGTTATYNGSFLDGPFQEVSAHGGTGTSGDGIGHVNADQGAYGNGGDGTIAGTTAATGDALATAQAFTANVVVGANVQVNNVSATVIGGNASEIDDIIA